jgi:hypothetical protein
VRRRKAEAMGRLCSRLEADLLRARAGLRLLGMQSRETRFALELKYSREIKSRNIK